VYLTVDGLIASRTGAVAALVFALIGIIMVPLVLSDVSGQPITEAIQPANWLVALNQVADAQAWLISAIIALVVGGAALIAPRTWMWQPVWLVGAILIVAPQGLSGHSAAGGDHDYGTNSLLWHVLFMMLWVGGLMALIAHGRRLGPSPQGAGGPGRNSGGTIRRSMYPERRSSRDWWTAICTSPGTSPTTTAIGCWRT